MPSPSDEVISVQACTLMKEIVSLTAEKWITASRFSTLAGRWGIHDLQARIQFLTDIKTLLRRMPVQVFADLDARQALLDAVQEALNADIETEEDPQANDLG